MLQPGVIFLSATLSYPRLLRRWKSILFESYVDRFIKERTVTQGLNIATRLVAKSMVSHFGGWPNDLANLHGSVLVKLGERKGYECFFNRGDRFSG
jgi:hypothetical protein